MLLKAGQILEIHEALEKLARLDLSLMTAIAIADNIDVVSNSYKIIMEKRQNILEKYAKKDEEGNYVKVADNPNAIELVDGQGYLKDLTEILESEIEVSLKEFSLEGEKNITIAPADILALRPLIKVSNSKDAE